MKKLVNISLLLLVLGLSGSFSCESSPSSWQTGPEEQDLIERLFGDKDYRPTTPTQQVEAPPAPVVEPITVEQEQVAINESTPHMISRTYPCAECGIVQLDKTMPKEVELNQPFDYSIKITNLTDMTLTDVAITESLPDSFKFTSAKPIAQKTGNNLKWEIYSLEPKASRQITVFGIAADSDRLKHYTTVVTNAIPACTIVRVVQPRLELIKAAPAEVLLCDPIPVKFVVVNSGTGSIRNIKIVDTLPTGLQTINGLSELVFDAGALTGGQSRQFSAKLRATKTGRYTNKAVASSATGLRAESAATTTKVGQPVLAIKKTGPEHRYIGRSVSYEITVTNKGDAAAKNTVIEDTIPAGVTSVEATAGGKVSGSTLVWELGTLSPNASESVSISYTPTKEGTLASRATATAYCADAVTASAKTSVTGISAVLLEVIDIEDPVKVGSFATYVITVTNQGSARGTNIRIACTLEHNVQYVSSAGATPGSLEGNTLRFAPLDSLAPQAKATWRVVVTGVKPGDVRFKVTMNADQLTRPVEETEATRLYE